MLRVDREVRTAIQTETAKKILQSVLPRLQEFDAILFDFDGVLADTEPVHWACWSEVLRTLGVTLEWEFYRDQCIGIDDREMLRMMAHSAEPPRAWESARSTWNTRPS